MAPPPQNKKKVKKLADVLKEIRITEADQTTPLGTVVNKLEDPALVAKWPKLRMKVPPIFLHKPVDFKEHALNLLKMGVKFQRPYLTLIHTKIDCLSFTDHRNIAQYFDKNKLPYHTYGHPTKRKMKVVIRGMPDDTDLNKVKQELKAVSVPIIRLHKMQSKSKDRPLLILVVVPHAEDGKRILAVKKILGHAVTLEPPKPRVKQCHRCQKWGHSQRYCHGAVKCVKCAGDHFSKKCTRDKDKEPPKCANCELEHTANFRGCHACPDSAMHKRTVMDKETYKEAYADLHGRIGPNDLPKLASEEHIETLYRNVIYYKDEPPMASRLMRLVEDFDEYEFDDDVDYVDDDEVNDLYIF